VLTGRFVDGSIAQCIDGRQRDCEGHREPEAHPPIAKQQHDHDADQGDERREGLDREARHELAERSDIAVDPAHELAGTCVTVEREIEAQHVVRKIGPEFVGDEPREVRRQPGDTDRQNRSDESQRHIDHGDNGQSRRRRASDRLVEEQRDQDRPDQRQAARDGQDERQDGHTAAMGPREGDKGAPMTAGIHSTTVLLRSEEPCSVSDAARMRAPCHAGVVRILIVTKGHPFQAEPFFAVFDALGHDWDHVEHPEAETMLSVEGTAGYDALVMYDMPGIDFTGADPPVEFVEPSPAFKRNYLDVLAAGRGMVFLHHAIASWPAWPDFAEIVGGRFHYQPGELRGERWPDSGYRFDVTHTVEVLDPEHPICAGLQPTFDIVDELYLFPVLAEDVVPLMRSTFDFRDEHFYSADLAIRGTRNSNDGWSHPPGSDLVAWVKHAGNSPVAYVQFADGPVTYADATGNPSARCAERWSAAERWTSDDATSEGDSSGEAADALDANRPGQRPPRCGRVLARQWTPALHPVVAGNQLLVGIDLKSGWLHVIDVHGWLLRLEVRCTHHAMTGLSRLVMSFTQREWPGSPRRGSLRFVHWAHPAATMNR